MSCSNSKVFETPYNNNPQVLAHTGIMFELRAKSKAFTIDTIELDARTGLGNPLNVDIYVTDSPVNQAFNKESSWELVARTKFVEDPDKQTVIVPSWQFDPITVKAGQKKGLYIRMKGNYIDNTVSNSIRAGNEAQNGPDMSIFAGYYLDQSSSTFPPRVGSDKGIIFAGKIHYKVSESCSQHNFVTTALEFALIIDTGLEVNNFNQIEIATFNSVNNLLGVDPELKNYVSKDGLKLKPRGGGGAKTVIRAYAGNCPRTWSRCDAVVTTVQLDHDQDRSSGDVKDRLYRYYRQVSQEQLKVLSEGTQASYVGLVDSKAEFRLVLDGVSEKAEMDREQQAYLQDQIVAFLDSVLEEEVAQAFNVNIAQQALFDIDSIEVEGTITGAVIASDTNVDFARRIRRAFEQFEPEFFEVLKYNMNYPGPISENDRHKYFAGASDLTMIVQADKITKAPTPAPTSEEDMIDKGVTLGLNAAESIDTGVFIAVGVVGGVVMLLTILYCTVKHVKKKRKKEAEKRERREERARMKAILRGEQPSEPPKQITIGQGDAEEENNDKKMKKKKSSRKGFLSRGESFTTNSDRFVDEASTTSSEGYNESSLLPSSKARGDKSSDLFGPELLKRHGSHRSGGFDIGGFGEDDAAPETAPSNFDPFSGKEADQASTGPSKMGFDPISGNERSYDGTDGQENQAEDARRPPRRQSVDNQGKMQRRRSSRAGLDKGSRHSRRSLYAQSNMAPSSEPESHASQRALNKIRDLEMQAVGKSEERDESSRSNGDDFEDPSTPFQKSFNKTGSSRSLRDDSAHSGASESLKKKKKKKKKKKHKSKSHHHGDDSEHDESLSPRNKIRDLEMQAVGKSEERDESSRSNGDDFEDPSTPFQKSFNKTGSSRSLRDDLAHSGASESLKKKKKKKKKHKSKSHHHGDDSEHDESLSPRKNRNKLSVSEGFDLDEPSEH